MAHIIMRLNHPMTYMSINQKPRKVGVIQFELEGLENQGNYGIILICREKTKVSVQAVRQGRKILLFFSFVLPGPQWMGWRPPTLGRAITLLAPLNSNYNLIWKHLSISRNNHEPNIWVPLCDPPKLAHKIDRDSGPGWKCTWTARNLHLVIPTREKQVVLVINQASTPSELPLSAYTLFNTGREDESIP